MLYSIHIIAASAFPSQIPGSSVLTATIEKKEGRFKVTEASIHQDSRGKPSDKGLDAFRCLCLAEVMITLATGIKSPDPQDEIDALKKNVAALQAQLKALPECV